MLYRPHLRRLLLVGLMTILSFTNGAAQAEQSAGPLANLSPQTTAPSTWQAGRGNPLWGIPLSSLTSTRDRPIFAPTRRPDRVSSSPQPQQLLPNRPPLSLVGAIATESEGVAIFLDETTKRIVRLRTGESHLGWTLQSVQGRGAILQRDRQSAVLELSSPPAR